MTYEEARNAATTFAANLDRQGYDAECTYVVSAFVVTWKTYPARKTVTERFVIDPAYRREY